MSVVAKFRCNESTIYPPITDLKYAMGDNRKIKLGAVYEPNDEKRAASENAIFGKATPHGAVEMTIMNPAAAQFFTPGKSYYVTFTEAPD